jgi:ribosome biogenesis protein UTP30
LAHIQKAAQKKAVESTKKNLLDDSDDEADGSIAEIPIWLTLTTKRHIVDSNRLKPGRIGLPHPLNKNESTSICLITADPQRAYKNIVASEKFPAALRARITRVIDVTKLKAKYKQYEAQRMLFSEHDIFLGDERIINRLPGLLGKTFYKTTAKRPIPVFLQSKAPKVDGKRAKRQKTEDGINCGTPADIAAEIEKASSAALVNLSPSTNTAIRVGNAGFSANKIAENVDAVVNALVEKWVPQKWKNVRSIYVKGPDTISLPIWLTDELWMDEKDVIADADEKAGLLKAQEKANIGRKRKSAENQDGEAKKLPSSKKAKLPESDDTQLDKQIADRKARLRQQKAAAKQLMED